MATFTKLTSRIVPLLKDDVDTDQIIPARFLKVVSKDGLGDALFADWRKDPEFVLNHPENRGAQILLAGHNFGCGSSREHAPWALSAYGFKAVVAVSFADIFKSNALKVGVLPVEVDATTHAKIADMRKSDRDAELTIDLKEQRLLFKGGGVTFPVDAFAKHCLLEGMDELGYLLSLDKEISSYESRHH
jgi:3-isopropylmalate/(R)-2-methylmalate dehydratase small subunit